MTAASTRVTLLTQPDCAYCDHAKQVLARVGQDYPLSVSEIGLDTEEGRQLAARGGVLFAPGILLDDEAFGYGRLSERRFRKQLARRTHSPSSSQSP